VLDPGNREAMRGAGTVVWLRARHETLAARVGDGSGRPLLSADGGPVAGAIARLDARRRSLYAEVSDGVVDVDDLEPDEVAGRVLVAAGLTGGDR
jgi:shikimate kinase